jgi:hypothetical protein
MTWLVYRLADRTGIEDHPNATVVSRHAALVRYRERREREALEAAGQGELFP